MDSRENKQYEIQKKAFADALREERKFLAFSKLVGLITPFVLLLIAASFSQIFIYSQNSSPPQQHKTR
jgi:hypothetical protein